MRTISGRYIRTVPRHGYQFVAPVTQVENQEAEPELELLLAPHRAWTEGRAALESLQCDRIGTARATFQRLLQQHPGEATYHIGMANACVMQFEATRTDPAPDAAPRPAWVMVAAALTPGHRGRIFIVDTMPASTQIARWGNSLGVRLPKAVAAEAQLAEGDTVEVSVKGGAIVVRPARPTYSLDQLVAKITPRNRHREADWGAPAGHEQW